MFLSKKYAYGVIILSAVFLTVAVLSFCRLKMLPRDAGFFEQDTSFPATTEWNAETTGAREINEVEPTMSAEDGIITEETTRLEIVPDETEPYYDPDTAQMIYRAAVRSEIARTQIVLSIASIMTVAMLAGLLVFSKRERCIEGMELSILFIAIFVTAVGALVQYYENMLGMFMIDPTGTASIVPIETRSIVLAALASLGVVWGIWTFVSWCRIRSDVSWSALHRLTEKLSLRKNGTALMIMIPTFVSAILMLAAVATQFLTFMPDRVRLTVMWTLLCEAAIVLFVLTDRMKAVRRKQEAVVEAARVSERMRVDLIANVSHDLRTPLTSIIGYGELLDKEELSEDGRKNLKKLQQKSAYLQEMVDSVFDLSKVSSGVVRCRQEEIDLIRLLEQTIGDQEEALNASGFEVIRHYETDHLRILSDGIFLHQIFSNLLSNAIKYTMPGLRIHLQVKTAEGQIIVRMVNVANYRMTFSETEILERFARGDASRSTEGNGLGLAIAKTYSEALGGSFRVEVEGDQFAAVVSLPETIIIPEEQKQ